MVAATRVGTIGGRHMSAAAAWGIIGAALVFLSLWFYRQVRLARDDGVVTAPGRPHLSARGDILWVTVTGTGQLGLDCMVSVRAKCRREVCVPVHVAVGGANSAGIAAWMTGLVEQWASEAKPLSMELLYSSSFDARAKVWQGNTSVVLDVRNPMVIRRTLSRSVASLADL